MGFPKTRIFEGWTISSHQFFFLRWLTQVSRDYQAVLSNMQVRCGCDGVPKKDDFWGTYLPAKRDLPADSKKPKVRKNPWFFFGGGGGVFFFHENFLKVQNDFTNQVTTLTYFWYFSTRTTWGKSPIWRMIIFFRWVQSNHQSEKNLRFFWVFLVMPFSMGGCWVKNGMWFWGHCGKMQIRHFLENSKMHFRLSMTSMKSKQETKEGQLTLKGDSCDKICRCTCRSHGSFPMMLLVHLHRFIWMWFLSHQILLYRRWPFLGHNPFSPGKNTHGSCRRFLPRCRASSAFVGARMIDRDWEKCCLPRWRCQKIGWLEGKRLLLEMKPMFFFSACHP